MVSPGQKMGLRISPNAVHLFDATTGRRLGAREAAPTLEYA